jgi:hypothetical protein
VTGADGKFRFPVEKTDGANPREIHAMLVDHYTKHEEFPTGPDPDNPSPRFYYGGDCMPEFKTPEDGVAHSEFASRANTEREKYFKRPASR